MPGNQLSGTRNVHIPLILASASPRRVDLLAQIQVTPDSIVPPHIDETPLKDESPREMAVRLCRLKALEVQKNHPDACIIAADTVVAVGHRILGKAENKREAKRMLEMLSGRSHKVIGGLCVLAPGARQVVKAVTTSVTFKRLDTFEIETYIQSEEWMDKAGAYAIQGCAGAFVRRINGSYTNVVGLPLFETANALKGIGFPHLGLVRDDV